MNISQRQAGLLLQAVQDGRLDYHARLIEQDRQYRQALRALVRACVLERKTVGTSLHFAPTPKGLLAAKAAALGLLSESQVYLLRQASLSDGTWTGGGGPAAMARRLKEAGLLESPDNFAYKTTDKGREALQAWKEAWE